MLPAKIAPNSLQEPLKNKISFGIDFLANVDPKMVPKVVQILKTIPKIHSKTIGKTIYTNIYIVLGAKMGPEIY